MNGLLWNISVASERRSGLVKMFSLLFCPKSKLIAQYTASKNSADALKICNLSRRARWTGENAVDGCLVKVVGLLEFARMNEVVIVESVSRLLSVLFGYSAGVRDERIMDHTLKKNSLKRRIEIILICVGQVD